MRSNVLLPLAPFAVVLALAPPARADESLPVIAAGREKDVLKLIAPYKLGAALPGGWHLETVDITGTFVRLVAMDAAGHLDGVRLDLPKRAPSSETTPSFAVHREPLVLDADGGVKASDAGDTAAAAPALDALVQAVRKNDDGKFWPEKGPTVPVFPEPWHGQTADGGATPAAAAEATPARGFKNLRRLLLGGGLALMVAILLLGRARPGKKS